MNQNLLLITQILIMIFYHKSPNQFLGIMIPQKGGCYWPTAESILNVNKQEDYFCKILFSACWNFICEYTNRKIFWLSNSSWHHLIQDSIPLKAYCECPVGVCGLCCHIIAQLLFLKHYAEIKRNFFGSALYRASTKWHCHSKKDPLPMMPLFKS